VNIPDVYEAEGFDFRGPRQYDAATGYRSQSMLVAPMKNFEDDTIGVLQLLNAKGGEGGAVVPFSSDFEAMITSLASQAAVAITNARLIDDLQNLFDAFIQSIAAAVDEKSPYTAGHVRRVADLTMSIAAEINRTETGLWGKIRFTEDELTELRLAAWMHDVGKITTPEYVVDKATKLETIHDRIETVRARYEVLKRDAEIAALQKSPGEAAGPESDLVGAGVDGKPLEEALEELRNECEFIVQCNTGGEFMADEDVARLGEIASRSYEADGKELPVITENEVYNLSIRKGTLTAEELGIMHNHAAVSVRMLSQLPFSKKLRRVAEFAGGHHETLNGKGYPGGLTAEALPLQARILAVADIFEALTASDRPYRRLMPLSLALKIIRENVERGELDGEIVDLFMESGLVHAYAERELSQGQIDVEAP
ncbi:MAG: HD domain-containing phosphohydrolase, partial [Candidatus Latescibacteria bacterium]|nr:HD domain-containing phosphohydrolase [Candidatus Latescibacterota bacterium]